MKDKGPKVFKLVKTNSALDFLKKPPQLAPMRVSFFDKIQDIVF